MVATVNGHITPLWFETPFVGKASNSTYQQSSHGSVSRLPLGQPAHIRVDCSNLRHFGLGSEQGWRC